MRLPRVRFMVRWLMVVMVIIAANLAAIAAVLREQGRPVGGGIGGGSPTRSWSYEKRPDGSFWRITRDTIAGVTLERTRVQPPTLLGLILVGWPLVASLSLSLAMLSFAALRRPDDRSRLPVEPAPPGPE